MSPRARKTPRPDRFDFDDETETDPVVAATEGSDEVTVPIDIREMEAAAKASRLVPEPSPRAFPRRTPAPDAPYAEVQASGAVDAYLLAARNVSATGVALEVPSGVEPVLGEGAPVGVHLHLGVAPSGERLAIRLRAKVVHFRAPRPDRPGGLALRWDLEGPAGVAELERLLGRAGRLEG